MESTSIYAALAAVQSELKAPKGQMNTFGGYRYRSCEDILEAVKPILKAHDLLLTLSDEPKVLEGWHYIEATAKLESLDGGCISVKAYAREPGKKTKMDAAQVTGTSSSYARKYALCGAFAIDGGADPDTFEVKQTKEVKQLPQTGPFTVRCKSCGTRYTFADATQYQQYIATAQCCPSPLWEIE